MMLKQHSLVSLRGFGVALALVLVACNDGPTAVDRPIGILASALSPATTFVGDRVKTTGTANIRATATASGTLLGTQPANAMGTIVAGPVTDVNGDRLTRWKVNFDTGPDGWAADSYLDQPVSLPAIASVTLSQGQVSMASGAKVQLTAVAKDAAGNPVTGAAITWATNKPAVATVSASGLVTAVAAGTATVTATSRGTSGTAAVTVTRFVFGSRVQAGPQPANIRSAPAGSASLVGQQPAGATGVVIGGPVIDVTGDKLVRWQIDFDNGVDGWAADTYVAASTAAPAVASVVLAPDTATVLAGQTVQLAAVAKDIMGVTLANTIAWTSLDTASATVTSAGLVTARAAGSARVVAASAGKSDTSTITVVSIPVASVTVTPDTATVITGQALQLAAVAKDAAGATLPNTMAWTSLDTTRAKVTAAGLVTAAAAGTALIVANAGGRADTAVIVAIPVPVASVLVTPATASIASTDSVQLSAVTKDSTGASLTGRAVLWTTSNAAAATVSGAGMVRAVGAGSATITATSGFASAAAAITVTAPMHTGYYVTTTGTSGGDGTMARPWNLSTALSGGGGRVMPGDTVWIRGGTYRGSFRSTVSGTSGAHVVIRQYPGERAIIDGVGTSSSVSVFYVGGQYSTFWGFEITNSDPVRTTTSTANNVRPNVVSNYASHNKYVNLVVHDGGVAFYNEATASDVEIVGCIVYNNGWEGPDRGHGHGLYLKSNTGPVIARDNVIFNQYGYGIHAYSNAGSGELNNIRLEGNISFNNGAISPSGTSANILLGGAARATGDVLKGNFTYFTPGLTGTNVKVGYGTLKNGDIQLDGNYFVGGGPVLDVWYWTQLTATANTLIGGGSMITQHDPVTAGYLFSGNTLLTLLGVPATANAVALPSPYEAGRANIVVYNWGHQGSVSPDLSGVLRTGDRYEVRNVQDLFGAPVVSGTYNGVVSIPMSGVNAPAPVGLVTSRAPRTGPDFDVFVVVKL